MRNDFKQNDAAILPYDCVIGNYIKEKIKIVGDNLYS